MKIFKNILRRNKKRVTGRRGFVLGVSIGLLLTVSVMFFAVPVHKAQAFPGEAMAAAVWKFASEVARDGWKIAKEAAEQAYKITKDVAFKNALRIYLTRIAEDTATYIATGDPGQKPLFLTNPGDYFLEVGDAALGDYLDTVSSGALGVSICDIGADSTIKINLALRAEINPNFCTDGCQRSFETKLNSLGSYETLLTYLQGHYETYLQEVDYENLKVVCEAVTTQIACDTHASNYCEWDSGNGECGILNFVDRQLNEAEYNGGFGGPIVTSPEPTELELDRQTLERLSQETRQAINRSIIDRVCSDGEFSYLGECTQAIQDYITNTQEQSEYNRQRCVRLCTGAKRTAKCSYTQIKENTTLAWKSNREYYDTIIEGFKSGNSEVSQYLQVYVAAREEADEERQKAKDELAFDEIGPVRSIITGSITTPSTLTQKAAEKPIEEAGTDTTTYTGSPIADAIGVFTDTLTKKLIERIFNPQKGFSNPSTPSSLLGSGGYNSGGIAAAKAQFAKDFTPTLTRQGNVNIDPVSQLVEDGVMDQDFAEAVRQELTIEEAMKPEKNLLHPDWFFGYNKNREVPEVGNAGYPATSFPILRSNRIIPVGWEIAAEYIDTYDQGSYTLSQIVGEFENEDSPFYRLVDPKWVLKAPFALCAKQGFGGAVADDSCLASQPVSSYLESNIGNEGSICDPGEHDTDGDGDCDTSDPPIFENTCQREQVCVDQQTCIQETQDGQGCEEYGYCTKELPVWRFQGEQCDAQYANCQGYIAENNVQSSYITTTLDSKACRADNVGCQRYCYRDTATGEFNCEYDESNELYTGNRIHFDKEVSECSASDAGCSVALRTIDGANILPNGNFEYFSTPFPVANQANFDGWAVGGSNQSCGAQSFLDPVSASGTAAMRIQHLAACAGPGGAMQYAQSTIDTGRSIIDRTFTVSFEARALNAPCSGDVVIDAPGFSTSVSPSYTSDYQRFNATVTFAGVTSNTFNVRFNAVQNCPLIIDDVKVEEGAEETTYRDYGADTLAIKLPPAHLNCTGDRSVDPAECEQYAGVCSADDVGCMLYTPATGGISLPAKVTDPSICDFENNPGACDQCPAAFAGCQALREVELTSKVPQATHPTRDSASHYPSPPAVAAGYVSIVPETGIQCSATYVGCEEYTNLDEVAQGGEGLGYFTTVRQCVDENDTDKAFYFSWEGSASTGYELVRFELKQSNAGTGPCTNLAVSSSPNAACVDGTPGNPVNDCSAQWGTDPSCYEFLDENGNAFYRDIDEVIFVTEQCQPHRNTLDGQTYYFDETNSASCPAQFDGCREYKGPTANNTRTLFTDDFESVSNPLNGWLGSVTTESTQFGGHSMQVDNTNGIKSVVVSQGKQYVLSFWAKSVNTTDTVRALFNGAPNDRNFTWNGVTTAMPINNQWTYYVLGPVELDWGATPDSLYIQSSASGAYIDNIVLTEAVGSTYLVRDSASSCNGFEGCKEYSDQLGRGHYLKSFTRLCEGSAVGCEALINTHNSDYPFTETINADSSYPQGNGSFGSQVPRDTVQFYVNDSTKYCSEESKGCMELGSMSLDQNFEVDNITKVYLQNNPDAFNTILCQEEAVGCAQYQKLENPASLAFFKDPGKQVCEYRKDDSVTGLTGWFKKGTNEVCNAPWARECPANQSTCREYFAPRFYPNPAAPGEQTYYYLDSSLDKNLCSTGIDPRNSCLGFQDTQAGDNIARPRFDEDDTNSVLSQSCTACSPDPATCGRNGNSPCCAWSSSSCSTDRAAGQDDVAPHYCIPQPSGGEETFQSCRVLLAGSYAVPNSSTIAGATNCGQTGQPECYDMTGIETPQLTDDWNAANEELRHCSNYACSANVIIPVDPDRVCEEWLECTKQTTVTKNGKETTVCLERSLKNRERYIQEGEGDNNQENLVKTSPGNIKDLANYSGLVNAGMFRSIDGELVDGLFPYSQFTEEGFDGAFIDVPNGDFEDFKISVSESPMPIRDMFNGSSWISTTQYDWKPTEDASGNDTTQIDLLKTDDPDIFSNQYLRVTSRNTAENGASVVVDTIGNIAENTEYFTVSFKARRGLGTQNGITVQLWQVGVGPVYIDGSPDGIELTDTWEEYVVKLFNNPGLEIDPAEGDVELRFLHRAGNVPSESFVLDDVSLKPVLHIQDGRSATPESGLYGYYFQAKMVPALGSSQGLTGELWNSVIDFQVTPNPGAGEYTFHSDSVNYPYEAGGICVGGPTPGRKCLEDNACGVGVCDLAQVMNASYTVQWKGGIFIENSDENRFYFNHDDGARLYVEDMNTPILDNWGAASSIGTDSILRDMPEGWHPVKVEWFNSISRGGVQMGWHPGAGGLPYLEQTNSGSEFTNPPCPQAQSGPYAQVCNNGTGGDVLPSDKLITELTIDLNSVFSDGFLIDSEIDTTIDFPNFNSRLNDMVNRGDAVGVRWGGEILADADGQYTFRVRHKDGFKLFIDDLAVPLGEDWAEGPDRITDVGPYFMSAGWHQIKIEFFKGLDQGADAAVMQFGWDRAGSTNMGGGYNVVPEDHLRAFPPTETGFVARECRSFPQSDALVCDYTDPQSGVNYYGWKGYCVERDPRDDSVCLNWWPIDVLSGDTNIFADQGESITRAPLYYCAQGQGVYDSRTFGSAYGGSYLKDHNGWTTLGCDGSSCSPFCYYCVSPLWNQTLGNRRLMSTPAAARASGDQFTGSEDSDECYHLEDNGPCRTESETNHGICGCRDDVIFDTTITLDAVDQYYEYQLEKIEFVIQEGSHTDWPMYNASTSPATLTISRANGWGRTTQWSNNSNVLKVEANFNATTKKLESFYIYMADGSGDMGGAWWAGIFHLRNWCSELVEVTRPNGDSAAWAAKIQSGTYPNHPLVYESNTACFPYGAVPVIASVDDVKRCTFNYDHPSLDVHSSDAAVRTQAQVNFTIGCDDQCTYDYCHFVYEPISLYTPDNSDFGSVSNICSETILGGGFYSCGGPGAPANQQCRVCIDGDNKGLTCFADEDCPNATAANPCQQAYATNEVIGDSDHVLTPLPGAIPTTQSYSAVARLKQIFARSYGVWSWNDSTGNYIRDAVNQHINWSPPLYNTQRCPAADTHVVDPNVYCGIEPEVTDLEVSGGYLNGTDIILYGANSQLDLSFDYTIDPEQQPLSSIAIDWGENDRRPLYQSTSASRVYRCAESDGVNCLSCLGGGSIVDYDDPTDLDTNGNPITKKACLYQNYPRVQVQDNWGWCNIRTGVTYTGENSCAATTDSWDWYEGNLVVLP